MIKSTIKKSIILSVLFSALLIVCTGINAYAGEYDNYDGVMVLDPSTGELVPDTSTTTTTTTTTTSEDAEEMVDVYVLTPKTEKTHMVEYNENGYIVRFKAGAVNDSWNYFESALTYNQDKIKKAQFTLKYRHSGGKEFDEKSYTKYYYNKNGTIRKIKENSGYGITTTHKYSYRNNGRTIEEKVSYKYNYSGHPDYSNYKDTFYFDKKGKLKKKVHTIKAQYYMNLSSGWVKEWKKEDVSAVTTYYYNKKGELKKAVCIEDQPVVNENLERIAPVKEIYKWTNYKYYDDGKLKSVKGTNTGETRKYKYKKISIPKSCVETVKKQQKAIIEYYLYNEYIPNNSILYVNDILSAVA